MKKFELSLEHTINWKGHTLYRIKACRDFVTASNYKINKGDLGGWVEKEDNLSQ